MECEEDVAKLLRKGDTWVHMYQLSGQTILNHEEKNDCRYLYYGEKRKGNMFS